jgi:large subunit ribosomal protein L3
MALGLIGKKLGMSQCFDEDGVLVPVTLLEAGPCTIVQKKVNDTDGYNALQLCFGEKASHRINQPQRGHLAKAKVDNARWIREVRVDDPKEFEVGQVLDLDIFEDGEKVDVIGSSKGRGFSGTIKRHGTSRGPETHGSRYHRRPGSMGASAHPSHVFKGKKLPGQYGAARVTAQNLKIIRRDKEKNVIAVKGSIPGAINGMVIIRKVFKAGKAKNKS